MKEKRCLHRKVWFFCAVMLLCLTGCRLEENTALTVPPETAVSESIVQIQTEYIALNFPEALIKSVRHMEVSEGDITMEVFYMLGQTREWELYRIIFGDDQMGDFVGYLSTAGGEVPVTVMLCEHQESFADENDRALFAQLFDAFNVVINSVYEDPRFNQMKYILPVQDIQVTMQYWTVTLPENVQVMETGQDDEYVVEFFGIVDGSKIPLYSICMGTIDDPEDVLGSFIVDGQPLPVSLKVFDTDIYEDWPQENQYIISNMMESINEVVFQLMGHENFLISN